MKDLAGERLYYTDPYQIRFEAQVVERLTWEGRPALVLDRTAFYPTSGGQPPDRGSLCDVAVVDVQVRDADGAVVHILEGNLSLDRVVGEVDWPRRFDHMQHHTGQHLLSAACERLLNADTVSFHLGTEVCTIDLNVARIPPEAMEPVEDLVNRVIWENRPVRSRFASPEELAALPLRRPPQVEGPVRLVEVEGAPGEPPFDLNPCGGTHVAHTGEVGLLKVIRLDYRGAETRVEFLCGGRALRDYRVKNGTVLALSAGLTVGQWELVEAVERLQEELKSIRRALRQAQERALEGEVARLAQEAALVGPLRVVWKVWEGCDPADLRALAQGLSTLPHTLALLASLGERVHLCFASSEDVEVDAAALLRAVCAELGGKGGGAPHIAQGSAPATDHSHLERVIEQVANQVRGG